jgi:hypothetical protein
MATERQWDTPVIPVTWEVEAKALQSEASLDKSTRSDMRTKLKSKGLGLCSSDKVLA